MQGMFHSSMKNRMDELEARQTDLVIRIQGAKQRNNTLGLTALQIKAYLAQHANIKTKDPEMQRRIIQGFVKKVVVFNDDTVDITFSVTFDGGGGGSRTRVRRPSHRSISERSPCFSSCL